MGGIMVCELWSPGEEIKLGRLILGSPHSLDDFHDPDVELAQCSTERICPDGRNTSGLLSRLPIIFNVGRTKASITADQYKAHRLAGLTRHFWKLMEDPLTIRWISERVDSKLPIYLVVGYQTALNPTIAVAEAGQLRFKAGMSGNGVYTVDCYKVHHEQQPSGNETWLGRHIEHFNAGMHRWQLQLRTIPPNKQ